MIPIRGNHQFLRQSKNPFADFMAKKGAAKKLTTTVLRKSRGSKVEDISTLFVHYQGTRQTDDVQFDASFDFDSFEMAEGRGPFSFVLGAGQVIEGWDKALKGRRLGEVLELNIPFDLAYGKQGAGEMIPPKTPLRFKVELLASGPAGSQQPSAFPTLPDIGIKPEKIGLTDELLSTIEMSKIALDGDDTLTGGDQVDLLIGLKGHDVLDGGRGGDVLIGGKGKDTFQYSAIRNSADTEGERDTILQFGRSDRIDVSSLTKSLSYIGSKPFSATAGEARFSNETLELDKNGDGEADFAVLMPNAKSFKEKNLIV